MKKRSGSQGGSATRIGGWDRSVENQPSGRGSQLGFEPDLARTFDRESGSQGIEGSTDRICLRMPPREPDEFDGDRVRLRSRSRMGRFSPIDHERDQTPAEAVASQGQFPLQRSTIGLASFQRQDPSGIETTLASPFDITLDRVASDRPGDEPGRGQLVEIEGAWSAWIGCLGIRGDQLDVAQTGEGQDRIVGPEARMASSRNGGPSEADPERFDCGGQIGYGVDEVIDRQWAFHGRSAVGIAARRDGTLRSMSSPLSDVPEADSPGASLEESLAEIEDRGYTILENVIGEDQLDAITEALDRIERDRGIGPAENDFEGHHTVRIYNLLAHGEPFSAIPIHPALLPVVEGVLDPGCLVSSLSSISIGPGEKPQPIHADDQIIGLARPHQPVVCNSMWAITDFTEENGATRIVPGSHKAPNCPEYGKTGIESIAAEMERGSILVWNGSLWHGGGANRTNERRIGIAMNYCAGFIRQQENQQLGIPRAVAAEFPERLQRLVGYGVYRHLIGHIDKRDPIELLGVEGKIKSVWDL